MAVVSGASAGIGEATAIKLVEAGLMVVGLARRLDRLDALARSLRDRPGKLYAARCDVTSEREVVDTFAWIKDSIGPVSVLVNSAGVARPTTLVGEYRR